jgi:hypothetical protein
MFASWTSPSDSAGVGRVNLNAEDQDPNFSVPGFSHKTTATNFEKDLLRGNWESTPVSQAFFSSKNIDVLQNAIRKSVYDKSGPNKYVIDNQSSDELQIIMRAYFLQYAKNLPFDVPGQVTDLNKFVIDWATRSIMSAVQGYHGYIKDITNTPTQMDRPVLMSSAGTKSLPFNNFV